MRVISRLHSPQCSSSVCPLLFQSCFILESSCEGKAANQSIWPSSQTATPKCRRSFGLAVGVSRSASPRSSLASLPFRPRFLCHRNLLSTTRPFQLLFPPSQQSSRLLATPCLSVDTSHSFDIRFSTVCVVVSSSCLRCAEQLRFRLCSPRVTLVPHSPHCSRCAEQLPFRLCALCVCDSLSTRVRSLPISLRSVSVSGLCRTKIIAP